MKELNDTRHDNIADHPLSEEAQQMCDEIAIINNGEIVAQDATKALLAEASAGRKPGLP